LAANAQGEIIGVPTRAGSGEKGWEYVDCRALADTNRDGVIDEKDSCVPAGGFINALRPIHLALAMIEAAKAGQVAIIEFAPPQAQEEYEPEGDVILLDEFNDNANNWEVGEFEGANIDITTGMLVMDVFTDNLWAFSAMQDDLYESVILVVDIGLLYPAQDGDFGFICNYQDDSNFVALEISADGYYSIWGYDQNNYTVLVDWTYSEVITSSDVYTLGAYCGPDRLALAVDEVLLVEAVPFNYRNGKVGLITGTYKNFPFTVGFDNFMILRP
jgi:hypothetical protein